MLSALALLGLAQAAAGPLDRGSLGLPPLRVFEQMLRYAGAGDTDKLRRSLSFLEPVLAEHREVLPGAPRPEAPFDGSTDPADLVARVQRLILRDVVVLLRRVPTVIPDQARTSARTAALEWHLVEGAVAAVDRRAALEIEGRIRDVIRAVEAEDMQAVGGQLPALEGRLLALFPEEGTPRPAQR